MARLLPFCILVPGPASFYSFTSKELRKKRTTSNLIKKASLENLTMCLTFRLGMGTDWENSGSGWFANEL